MRKRDKLNAIIPSESIEKKIFLIRGQKVMIDAHLAKLYAVATKNLNKAVARNKERFPEDFMFQLSKEEADDLRLHLGTSKSGRGGRRYLPYAFTEQGVAMISSVLRSRRAVQVNIAVMRTFVKLREILSTHKALALKLKQLEMKVEKHDADIQAIFNAIRQLMAPPPPKPKRPMGFELDK